MPTLNRKLCLAVMSIVIGSFSFGCDNEKKTETPAPAPTAAKQPAAPATQPLIPVTQMIDWCPEHAMPETICVQCNSSLATGFKAKGDWDEQHNLPKSQCFKCDPSLKAKFAAAYKATYGKDVPSAGEH